MTEYELQRFVWGLCNAATDSTSFLLRAIIFVRPYRGCDGIFIGVTHAKLEMVRAQKNQFKEGRNMPFTFLREQRLIQTVEETDLGTPHPIALSLLHCRTSP